MHDPYRLGSTEVTRAISRIQDKLWRPENRGKVVEIGAGGKVRFLNRLPYRANPNVTLKAAERYRHYTLCGLCHRKCRTRVNEYGRWEWFCKWCFEILGIRRLREILEKAETVGEGIQAILDDSRGDLDSRISSVHELYKSRDPAILDQNSRVILSKGPVVVEGPGGARYPMLWRYEEAGSYFYFRCEHCECIQRIQKRDFIRALGSSRIFVERHGHCQTCPTCGRHAYRSFEGKEAR